ncbi:hypothetical protein AALP_AA6G196900 [Arabis alpina]|uniref:Uncharacterized protein n=1 Tax=Arabis alpina TaxID=50452 RepID=A0A087GQC7_ARAAL|nr:hypothetical protein AALP_AA6G196900 [Arabis alpina]
MSGSVSSNDSTKLVRRSIRKTTTADHASQSVVRADPLVELIAISSRENDSSHEGLIDATVRASPSDREGEVDSREVSDRLDYEPEEEDEDGEDRDEEEGHLRQYDQTLDVVDKPVYTLYTEELIRVESLKGKLDRQVEISLEMTLEAKDAREREKATSNRIGMLRAQPESERNEKDIEILSLKEKSEKLKTAADAEEVNRVNSLINQVSYSLELYAKRKEDGIAVPDEKVEKLQENLKRLNAELMRSTSRLTSPTTTW